MPPLAVVLDTNVVVSAHLHAEGYPRFVLDLGLAAKIQLYISPAIATEYDEVLGRERFAIDPKKVTASMRLIKKRAILVKPVRAVSVSPDPDDNKFLECAEEASADYLVDCSKSFVTN